MPQILNANDLPTGDVVYWDGSSWVRDIRRAALIEDTAIADTVGANAVAACRVVEPYVIDVALTDAGPRPTKTRERVRATGPSVRPDLGKQAGDY